MAFIREILDIFTERLFEEGFLLVGGFVQRLYSEAFDVPLPLFATRDVDLAVERPYHGKEFPLVSEFEKRGFETIFCPMDRSGLKKALFE